MPVPGTAPRRWEVPWAGRQGHRDTFSPGRAGPGRRWAPAAIRRAAARRASAASAPYLMYLLPGAVLFTVVIAIPLVMNIYTSFTNWTGVGPGDGPASPTTGSCCHDSEFWASMWHSLALVARWRSSRPWSGCSSPPPCST